MQPGPICKRRRPALVLVELTGDDLILCQITSQAKADGYALPLEAFHFVIGGLNQSSRIRPNRLFPADSNIVRLQHEGYLFPDGVGQDDFLAFTFGASTIDLTTAPRDTRLRRAVIEHLQRGGEMRGGGFLFLRRDLPRFGSQLYRHNNPLIKSDQ